MGYRQELKYMINKVFLVPHTHTDIGYTDIQSKVLDDHIDIIDKALFLCKKTDNYPEPARFHWTCEVFWQVEHYFNSRPQKIKEFLRKVREGRIEITCMYLNLTDLFTLELLLRSFYSFLGFKKRYGIKICTGMNCDINGLSWTIPQILNKIGIKYLLMATDEIRGFAPDVKRPFWWAGPDGSKVLVWNASRNLWYAEGIYLGFYDSFDKVSKMLPEYLKKVEKDYQYDAISLQVSMDNMSPDLKICNIVKEWNEKRKIPFIKISTPSQFFRYMEKKYGKECPSYKLAWPDWWADGNGSCAFETSLCLKNSRKIVENEAIYSYLNLMEKTPYPYKEIEEIYKKLFFFGEHTFGADCSIKEPFSSQTLGQWAIKAGYVYQADIENRRINKAVKKILEENQSEDFKKVDMCNRIENKFYIIEVDINKGFIKSIFDKETGEELCDVKSIYGFNQYIYENTGSPLKRDSIWDEKSELPLWAEERKRRDADFIRYSLKIVSMDTFESNNSIKLLINGYGKGCKSIESEIILSKHYKFIEIRNTLYKEETLEPEGVYFAFPFNFRYPEIKLCGPGKSVFTPGKEQLPSTCMDWYSVEDWVILSDKNKSVLWVSPDAPLVQLSQINTGRWLKSLNIEKGTVFSYVMNNYWYTNFRAFQCGKVSFRYFITSGKPGMDNSTAFHLSQQYTQPVYFNIIKKLIKTGRKNIFVLSFKKSEDKKGYIIRLKETDGKDTQAKLGFNFRIKKVYLTDIGENNLKSIAVKGNEILLKLCPFEICTLKVIPEK